MADQSGVLASSDAGRRLRRRVVGVYAASASGAIAFGGIFFLFGLDLTPHQMRIIFGLLVPIAMVPMLAADYLAIRVQLRPIQAWFDAAGDEARAEQLAGPALVRALNLPILAVARVMFVHMPAFGVPTFLLAVLANRVLWLGILPWQLGMLAATMALFSGAHAIFEYFGVQAAARPVIPLLRARCPTLSPELEEGLIRLDTRQRLLIISGFVVLVPNAALGLTVYLKHDRILDHMRMPEDVPPPSTPLWVWILMFVVLASAIALVMSILIARDVSLLTSELRRAMRRVEEGRLDTRLAATTTDEFAEVYDGFNRMTKGLAERELLRDAFGRYVAPEIAEQVVRGGVSVMGQSLEASVLFADIRGFTDMSERMKPAEVVSLLNRYVAAVEPAIRAEGGWVNKFGGDSILAVFGAPMQMPDHAARAVRAALGMSEALARFNAGETEAGRAAIRFGIGLHTGELVAGSVGSPDRMEYTVIGDVVNVASRIQSLTKDYGAEILVSREIFEAAGPDVRARAVPPATVRGKSQPLVLYTLDEEMRASARSIAT